MRSGFVSIVGRPNSGKSTLLNALVGSKIAIVSDKPQTTRASIQGVLHADGAQAIFRDTPGIHKADSPFNRRMMRTVREALADPDVVVYVADGTLRFTAADAQSIDAVKTPGAATLLLLNKIDKLKVKHALLPLIGAFAAQREFAEVFPVSALTGEGLDAVRQAIVARLPEGPALFPRDYLTDQPERFLAAEIIREKILAATRQEVPHAVAVLIDKWEDDERLLRIIATVYVEREGQKGIVIGRGAAALKSTGSEARVELEGLLGRKIFLELFVKVRPRWRESTEFLNALDWRTMAGTEGL